MTFVFSFFRFAFGAQHFRAGPLSTLVLALLCLPGRLSATTYYVSSLHGNNDNKGTSEKQAWADFAPVNGHTFDPGDRILLERGSVWNNTILSPKGSGKAGMPIAIASYGASSARPVINANGYQSSLNGMTSALIADTQNYPHYRYGSGAITLFNQQFWEIYDLELTNRRLGNFDPSDGANNFSGIRVWARNAGKLSHIYIRGNYVHDVTGMVSWSGDRAESKRTGGIVVYTWDYNSDHTGTHFDDIRIESNFIVNVSMEGIAVQQASKTNLFARRKSYGDADTYLPYTNVSITGNMINNMADVQASDGIQTVGLEGGLVANNLVLGGGCVGIEEDFSNGTVIERNEVAGVRQHYINGGGIDHAGIDIDAESSNIVVQYNYAHDNGEGIIVDAYGFGHDNIVRYNLLVNNDVGAEGTGDSHIPGDQLRVASESGTAFIYNNTLYSSNPAVPIMNFNQPKTHGNQATYFVENNVFFGGSSAWPGGTAIKTYFSNNAYFGNSPHPSDGHAVTTDPRLFSPGKTDYSLKAGQWPRSLLFYQMRPDSPLRGAGKQPTLPDPRVSADITQDLYRHRLTETPSIGADTAGAQGDNALAQGTAK